MSGSLHAIACLHGGPADSTSRKKTKTGSSGITLHDEKTSADAASAQVSLSLSDFLVGALPSAIWPWLFSREVSRLRRVSVAVARTAREIEATTGRRLNTHPIYSVYVSKREVRDPQNSVSGAVVIHASSGPFHHSTILYPGCTNSTWQSFVYRRNEEMSAEMLCGNSWGRHPEQAHTCMWACGEHSFDEYPAWQSAGRAVRGYVDQGDFVRWQAALEDTPGTLMLGQVGRNRWSLRSSFGKWDDWALELWRGETLMHRIYHERPVGSTPLAMLHRALRQLLGAAPGEEIDAGEVASGRFSMWL